MTSESVVRRGTRTMGLAEQMRRAIAEFFLLEVSGSVALLATTALALLLANSSLSADYFELWETKFGLQYRPSLPG